MKNKRINLLKIVLCIFFFVTVIYPLFIMLLRIKDTDTTAILTSPQFIKALKNSLLLAVSATFISIILAFSLAWCVERSAVKCKGAIKIFMTLPMLIPSISHGMGLIILLGANGLITNRLHIGWNIYGAPGIIIGSVMYSFPVAFLMFSDIIKYEDGNVYQAAQVLGIPKWNQFIKLTCSYLKKPIISIAFAIFTLIITDYGVPLMVGGKCITLPVLIYQDVIGLLDFGKGSTIGLILLIPSVFAFLADLMNQEQKNTDKVSIPYIIGRNTFRDIVSSIYCVLMSILVTIPILTFVLLSFVRKYPVDMSFSIEHITRTFNMSGGKYLLNSLFIAMIVAALGVMLAFTTAYLTTRCKSRVSHALHLFSIISLAIPGIVLGLSYAMAFKKLPIYGTFVILFMVNLIHFFSNPYLMMRNTLNKINENLESTGSTLGISRFHIIRDVIIPQTIVTSLEMFSYFFVNCMMTISAVSFLVTLNTKTLSLMITQFEAQMMLECSAFVSLLILSVNLFIKYLIHMLKGKCYTKNRLAGKKNGIIKKTI